ncbi:MAG: DUF1847 domain-containing protein [bacterium]
MGGAVNCADCGDKRCYGGRDCFGLAEESAARCADPTVLAMTRVATRLEGRHYMQLCRLEELARFCREMGYRRLGIAFCIGLADEARVLAGLLAKRFEVESVCCKVGGVEKERFGLDKIKAERVEAMCNPVGQALALNKARTDLNIIVGLCIGHDITFTQHSAAPVTTFVVKDRLLAHNPAGALYSGYWRRRIERELEDDERA